MFSLTYGASPAVYYYYYNKMWLLYYWILTDTSLQYSTTTEGCVSNDFFRHSLDDSQTSYFIHLLLSLGLEPRALPVLRKHLYHYTMTPHQNCCHPHCQCHHLRYSVPQHIIVLFSAKAKPSGHVTQAWAIPPPSSWGLHWMLSQWHWQQTTTPETNEASSPPPPEPGDVLKRFYTLYNYKWCYNVKKVSKLYYMLNRLMVNVHKHKHLILAQIVKNSTINGLTKFSLFRKKTIEKYLINEHKSLFM